MLFTSPIFLFSFLPLFLLAYFVLPKQWRNGLLFGASLIFYSWGEGRLLGVMLFSTVVDYLAGLGLSKGWRGDIRVLPAGQPRSRSQKVFLWMSIFVNLSMLGFFKYFNFGLANVTSLFSAIGLDPLTTHSTLQIVLPLGISFYTFQSMSYTIDVYRGHVRATRHFVDFAAYVTMFPQLVAGPIIRYADVSKQLILRVVTREGFAYGVRRFIVGLAKKVLIANTVAIIADQTFAQSPDNLGIWASWLGIISYALQIYFDFSGYSDMAIGLGHMLGFKFLENFNYPYIAQSVKEFWRRWHISLSTWFRDYVYIPLGGNRRSHSRTYINLLVVFFVTGLWHGASWNFVVWGMFHGFFLMLERLGLEKVLARVWQPIRHGYTLLAVLVGWVFFRAETLPDAWSYLRSMFGFNSGVDAPTAVVSMTGILTLGVILGAFGSTPIMPWLRRQIEKLWTFPLNNRQGSTYFAFMTAEFVLLFAAATLAIMQLASDSYNPFIYFRF